MPHYEKVFTKSRRCQYTEETVKKAIEAVRDGMTQREASKRFSIPRATIGDKIASHHTSTFGGQCIPVLSDGEEKTIARSICTMDDWGYAVGKLD